MNTAVTRRLHPSRGPPSRCPARASPTNRARADLYIGLWSFKGIPPLLQSLARAASGSSPAALARPATARQTQTPLPGWRGRKWWSNFSGPAAGSFRTYYFVSWQGRSYADYSWKPVPQHLAPNPEQAVEYEQAAAPRPKAYRARRRGGDFLSIGGSPGADVATPPPPTAAPAPPLPAPSQAPGPGPGARPSHPQLVTVLR